MNPKFVQKTLAFKGEEGQKWLDSIPTIIQEYEKKWGIKVNAPFDLTYNYVAPVVLSDGEQAVLKIGYPGEIDFIRELEALRFFRGHGVCMLLDSDPERSVILIEKVMPGVPVASIQDEEEATRIMATTMRKIWIPAPEGSTFPTLDDWFKGFARLREKFGGTTGPLPEKIVEEGEQLYRHLLSTGTELYLLHGDLHQNNVLSATREPYLAIDPQGVIGERIHETAAMLRNPQVIFHTALDPKEVLRKRISVLASELGADEDRIRQWGVAQSVLSAIWSVEDNETDWSYSVTIAEILSELKS